MELLFTLLKESFVDGAYNNVSKTILTLILLIASLLILALFSKKVEKFLMKIKVLEEHEKPRTALYWVIGIIISVKLFQAVILQPFIVDGGSMLPTFHSNDFLLVDKMTYLVKSPERGQVVIFKLFEGDKRYEGRYLIKRIVGLPGEHVVVNSGQTIIYNKENPNGFVYNESFLDTAYSTNKTPRDADMTLADGEYFVMGDNRDGSYDSRMWGPLKAIDIRGRAFLRLWPNPSLLPGDETK